MSKTFLYIILQILEQLQRRTEAILKVLAKPMNALRAHILSSAVKGRLSSVFPWTRKLMRCGGEIMIRYPLNAVTGMKTVPLSRLHTIP